jgi:hypothetical protein
MLCHAVLGGSLTLLARVPIAASPVGVYLDFDEPPSNAAVEAMRKEASGVLDRVGIRIAWRLVSQNQGNEPFERLAVVKFTGKCTHLRSGRLEHAFQIVGQTGGSRTVNRLKRLLGPPGRLETARDA